MKTKNLLLALALSNLVAGVFAQSTSYDIRLNQVGFLPNAIKLAAVVNAPSDSFSVRTSDMATTVFRGKCLPSAYYSASDENVRIADFTLVKSPGEYVVVIDGLGKSVPFAVGKDVFTSISKSSLKAFYYNRASMPILSAYGGKFAREAGHPDTAVVVLPSAASANRPAGTKISTPGGWYDAGDYNKYIVNSGISTFTLLSAYETYPEYFDTLNLNIPESNNAIPDLLDEAAWNIKWMMTMQDTTDGGVYNKTTEAQFSAFVMPSKVTSTRYVTAKSTAATLDFAAVMAMVARIYKKYMPEMADQALKQSLKAWEWAQEHPNVEFKNPASSGGYPAVSTGEYGNSNFDDEFSWCAAELFITTQKVDFYNKIGLSGSFGLPGWGDVKTLGLLSLAVNKNNLSADADTALIKTKLMDLVNGTASTIVNSPYRIPGDFYYWGGNNAYANWGMMFMQAFRITKNATYFNAALSSFDYLLGRNATTYCFVTGAGAKSPMNIHHRVSGSDGIVDPVPGFLVGGPATGSVSDCGASKYPSNLPAKSYADLLCSYSTNEIAINWNAPLAFLAGAIQCEYLKNFTDSMPSYFSVSTSKIALPYKADNKSQVVIEGNTQWTLTPSANWISISATSGTGCAVIEVSSNSDNSGNTSRDGKIYVYNASALVDSIAVTQNGIRKNFTIQAEDYSSMSGLQTESTSDDGGGFNLGYVDIDDWACYPLDISNAGVYNVTFRHAGYAADIDVNVDEEKIANVSFAKTADWQVWESFSSQMGFAEGQHTLTLKFNSAGVNLNWIQFDWVKPLSIINAANNQTIRIYPVPANKYLNIEFSSTENVGAIQLLSVDGKQLININNNKQAKVSVDVSGLKRGIYVLKVNIQSDIYTRKIILN
jgi:endoglucanase